MKKWIKILSPLILIVASIIGAWRFFEPRLTHFILNRAFQIAKEKAHLEITADNMDIRIAPPGVRLVNAKVKPLTAEMSWLKEASLGSAEVRLDFLQLLGGRLGISLVLIEKPSVSIDLDSLPESDDSIKEINLNPLFNALDVVGLRRAVVIDGNLKLESLKKGIHIESSKINLRGLPNGEKINLVLQSGKVSIKFSDFTLNPIDLKLNASAELSQQRLRIDEIHLANESSFITFQGQINDLKNFLVQPEVDYRIEGKGFLFDIRNILVQFKDLDHVPVMKGIVKVDTRGSWKGKNNLKADFKIGTEDVLLGNYTLGNLTTEGKIDHSIISFDKTKINHYAGIAELSQTKIFINENYKIDSKVDIEKLNLQNLFLSLGLKQIPVDLFISGPLNCKGFLKDFNIKCDGHLKGTDFEVRSEYKKSAQKIVALQSFEANGNVQVDLEKVTYDSDVKIANDVGHSHGEIKYSQGFNIDYDTESVNLNNIKKIAGLSFEGTAKIHGSTRGDSSFGIIDMKVGASQFWFEDFGLGDFQGHLGYEKGILKINAETGKIGKTLYTADVNVNLKNNTLQGMAESAQAFFDDVPGSLARIVKIPFNITGVGNVKAQFSGPFSLGQLTYDLNIDGTNGIIADQSYDKLQIHLVSNSGHVKVSNNFVQRKTSKIEVDGTVNPHGELDLIISGKNVKLEDSDHISKTNLSLTGLLGFQIKAKDYILKPSLDITGGINNMTIGENEFENSNFSLSLDTSGVIGNTSLVGGKIISAFVFPFTKDGNLPSASAKLYVETRDLDFTELLGLLFNSPQKSEYRSSLNMKLDLQSENENIFDASGVWTSDLLYISRGSVYLSNINPLRIDFKSGVANIKNLLLKGTAGKISVEGTDFTAKKLDLNLLLNTDIKLAQIFLPFLDELGGPVNSQMRIKGSLFEPDIFGQISTDEAFLRLKGLPHSFEKIKSQIEFNHRKISISAVHGIFAGGKFEGHGEILPKGLKNIDIKIEASFNDISLNIPDKVKTQGTAQLQLNGSWFPYTLSGVYHVQKGSIEKDFLAEDQGVGTVKQSIYLPKALKVNNFDPIHLDLQVLLEKDVDVKNPQMEGKVNGTLQVKGPPEHPGLIGQVHILTPSKLIVRENVFDVQTGLIKFNDPEKINPEFYISARSLISKYDVTMLLQGDSIDPKLVLSSQPPLSEQDLISLLALGVTSTEMSNDVSSNNQATNTVGHLTGSLVTSLLQKDFKKTTGLDFKLATPYDDTKNEIRPRFTVSKKLSQKVNATGATDLKGNYDLRVNMSLNENLSVVGTYEKTTSDETSTTAGQDRNKNIFGIDLEYKMEFR